MNRIFSQTALPGDDGSWACVVLVSFRYESDEMGNLRSIPALLVSGSASRIYGNVMA